MSFYKYEEPSYFGPIGKRSSHK